jgi:nicotinamide riboside kinase
MCVRGALQALTFSKRIAFIGAHSAGKDTLSHYAFAYLKKKKRSCYYITEVAEKALMRGMDLNTPEGQLFLLGYQIKAEMEAEAWDKREFIICNRGVIDSIPYSEKQGKEFQYTMQALIDKYLMLKPYHMVILLRPYAAIENDGLRDMDRGDQLQVDAEFLRVLNDSKIPYKELNAPTKEKREVQLRRILRAIM